MGKFAVILIFSLVIALFTYNAIMSNLSSSTLARNIESYNVNQARNIANSAVHAILQKLVDPDDDDFDVSSNSAQYFPSGGLYEWEELKGEYRYHIENQDDTLLIVTSTGEVGENTYSVQVALEIGGGQWKPQFPLALFAEESIEMHASSRIVGHAGTNSTESNAVRLTGMATIDSSLYIGPGGNPDNVVDIPAWRPLNQAIKGGIHNLHQPKDYPMPEFPDFPYLGESQGDITVSGGPQNNLILQPAEFNNLYFDEIKIQNNRTLTLNLGDQNRTIRLGTLNIQQGHLILNGSGTITFYVENEFKIGGSSTLNQNGNASQSMIYYKGTDEIRIEGATKCRSNLFIEDADIVISGSGAVPLETGHIISGGQNVTISGAGYVHSGVIYAPTSHVILGGSGSATTSIVSNTFESSGNARVFYPDSIGDDFPNIDMGESEYVIKSWN